MGCVAGVWVVLAWAMAVGLGSGVAVGVSLGDVVLMVVLWGTGCVLGLGAASPVAAGAPVVRCMLLLQLRAVGCCGRCSRGQAAGLRRHNDVLRSEAGRHCVLTLGAAGCRCCRGLRCSCRGRHGSHSLWRCSRQRRFALRLLLKKLQLLLLLEAL